MQKAWSTRTVTSRTTRISRASLPTSSPTCRRRSARPLCRRLATTPCSSPSEWTVASLLRTPRSPSHSHPHRHTPPRRLHRALLLRSLSRPWRSMAAERAQSSGGLSGATRLLCSTGPLDPFDGRIIWEPTYSPPFEKPKNNRLSRCHFTIFCFTSRKFAFYLKFSTVLL